MEKRTKQFIEKLDKESYGQKPLYELTPDEARKVLSNIQLNYEGKMLEVDVQDLMLNDISFRIVKPMKSTENLPVIFYLHGGGWVLGDAQTHDRLVRELVVGTNCAMVFLNYPRSPEAKYPVAINQAYDLAHYIFKNGAKYQLDGERMVIAGDSVGGNMATVVCLMSIERDEPIFLGQLLFYPVTDARMNTQSYSEYENGPWLTKKAMEWFWDCYTNKDDDRSDYKLSPINTRPELLRKLPTTLLIVDENDVLRDQGENYAHLMIKEGVDVTAIRILGTIHDFMMLNPLARTPATKFAVESAINKIKGIFGSYRGSQKNVT